MWGSSLIVPIYIHFAALKPACGFFLFFVKAGRCGLIALTRNRK